MKDKNNHNRQQDIEIKGLATSLKDLRDNFQYFRSNEFQHLRSKVDEIENRISLGFIVMIGSTLILEIVLRFIK